jgi:hypothetical protein
MLISHSHRAASVLAGELPEESDRFHFLCAVRLANLKGSVDLILAKGSVMRVDIPIEICHTSPSFL